MAESERSYGDDAKEWVRQFFTTHPGLPIEPARSAMMDAYPPFVAEPEENRIGAASEAGRTIPKNIIPKFALTAAKMLPGVLLRGVGTLLGDTIAGRFDPTRKTSSAKIAGPTAVNLVSTAVLEAALAGGGLALGGPVGLAVGAALDTVLGTGFGEDKFDRFLRPDAVATSEAPASPEREINPDTLNDLRVPAPVPWDTAESSRKGEPVDHGPLAPRERQTWQPRLREPEILSDTVITMAGASAEGGGKIAFGPFMSGGVAAGREGILPETINLPTGTVPPLVLPGAIPNGTYGFSGFMRDGSVPDAPPRRQEGFESVETDQVANTSPADAPLPALMDDIDAPMPSFQLVGDHRRRTVPRDTVRPTSSIVPPVLEIFKSSLGHLILHQAASDARPLGEPAGLPLFDRRDNILPDPAGYGRSSASGSGAAGAAEIIAAINQLGDLLKDRPVKAYLDGRDVTDIVNSHNARWSNAPIGGTSSFDSSAGFTPIGAHTD